MQLLPFKEPLNFSLYKCTCIIIDSSEKTKLAYPYVRKTSKLGDTSLKKNEYRQGKVGDWGKFNSELPYTPP